jgi:hypothetical protein
VYEFLKTTGTEDLSLLVFMITIATTVQFLEILIEKYLPAIYNSFGIYLPLITVNCIVLAVSLFFVNRDYSFAETAVYGFGSGIGWMIAIILLAAIREKMKEAIQLMVNGTQDDIHTFIADFRKEFKTLPVEEISFPRGLNGLNTYSDAVNLYKKGTPIHVKGAIIYNANLKRLNLTKKYPLIQEGEKVKFTYLKMPNPFKDTVISYPSRLPKEFEMQQYIDYDMQFDKAFLEPIKVILDCMKWSTEKTSSIEDFFS